MPELRPVYCHTDPGTDYVWYADSETTSDSRTSVAIDARATPVRFFATRQLTGRTVCVLGCESNSELLVAAAGARKIGCMEQLLIASPRCCDGSELQFAAKAINLAMKIECPSVVGGWHSYSKYDEAHTNLRLRMDGNQQAGDEVFGLHPCSKLFHCLAGADTRMLARLWYLANVIVDPRWHSSSSRPDCKEGMYSLLGADFGTAIRMSDDDRADSLMCRRLAVVSKVTRKLRYLVAGGQLDLKMPEFTQIDPSARVAVDARFLIGLIDAYWRDQLTHQSVFPVEDYFVSGVCGRA